MPRLTDLLAQLDAEREELTSDIAERMAAPFLKLSAAIHQDLMAALPRLEIPKFDPATLIFGDPDEDEELEAFLAAR